jgi:hypothetical protein
VAFRGGRFAECKPRINSGTAYQQAMMVKNVATAPIALRASSPITL